MLIGWSAGWGQLVQDADLASGDGCGREDRGAEQLLADRLRTGESEEEPSAFDLRQRPGIEPLVALHGIAQHFVVLGEGRRVEDDHVVPVADVLEVFDGIDGQRSVGSLFSEVEPNVGVGQGDGPLRGVDRAYFACPARKSIYRKSARVAEGIEDRASPGVAAYQFAVEALVDKEARFLPLFPIDQEFFAVFEHGAGHSSRFAVKVPVHGIQAGLERYGLGTFVVDGGNPVAVNRSDRIGDCQAGVVHAHRVTLNHGGRVVNIDDESRQGVPLAVNQTVAGGVGGIREPERAAHVECGGDHPLPPGRVIGSCSKVSTRTAIEPIW